MPTPATDRQRNILIGVAVTSVALAAFAMRTLSAATVVAAKPLPKADLQTVTAFLGPLPDSTSLAGVAAGFMVEDRDPFGAATIASNPRVRNTGADSSRPKAAEGRQWVVSSILFEDTKRSAIVNNAWVSVGDPVGGGARLTAIERKHVVVTDANGTRHIVSIQGGEREN